MAGRGKIWRRILAVVGDDIFALNSPAQTGADNRAFTAQTLARSPASRRGSNLARMTAPRENARAQSNLGQTGFAATQQRRYGAESHPQHQALRKQLAFVFCDVRQILSCAGLTVHHKLNRYI
jgi:hypothetical protein